MPGRRGPIALRLAAASLARNPGHAAIAATFLVASLGLALFAVGYRSTLTQGQRDEAAFAVPADYVLTEDFNQLVPGAARRAAPAQAVDAGRCGSRATSRRARRSASSRCRRARSRRSAAGASDFALEAARAARAAVAPERDAAAGRWRFHRAGSSRCRRPARATTSACARSSARALGDYVAVALGHTRRRDTVVLHGRIPFRHATLAQLRFDILNSGRLTANAGTGIQPSAKGDVIVRHAARQRDSRARRCSSWVGTGGVGGRPRRSSATSSRRTGPRTYRPASRPTAAPLPVLVTPRVAEAAGPHGVIPLDVEGEQIAARIVGIVQRFPSIQGDAVVADIAQAGDATRHAARPGSERPTSSGSTGASPATRAASVVGRRRMPTRLRRLQADPLARGALLTLAGTAAVALLLALVGLCSRSWATCATTAASSSTSRRRARRRRRSARTCGFARAARRDVRRRRRPRCSARSSRRSSSRSSR